MVRLVRNPVVQFLTIGLLLFSGIVVATTLLADRAASREALADARFNTLVLARSVAEPELTRGLVAGRAGSIDRFDREVGGRLLIGDVKRIKIWAADGTIVYSDVGELIGTQYDLGDAELEILAQGGIEAEISDLSKPENRFEAASGGLVEVYTQVTAPGGEPLLFEAYYYTRDIDQRRQEVFLPFRRIVIGSLLAILAVATPMIWALTKRLTGAARERERLLESAIDASDAERRRIARDLHDGVVQDLVGTTFSVTALSREAATPPGSAPRSNRREPRYAGRCGRCGRCWWRSIHPTCTPSVWLPRSLTSRRPRRPRGCARRCRWRAWTTPPTPPLRSSGGWPRRPCATRSGMPRPPR